MADTGKLFVLSAPSGAGKTTLARSLLAQDPALRFSVSFTTRPRRAGEEHGRDYFFVDHARFEAMIAAGELLEHARVFDNYYGTGRTQVEAHTAAGRHVLLDIDWQGARQVRAHMPESVLIFILPPSLAELERRLRGRGTDAEAVIRRRLAEARDDMGHWAEFDHVVVNDQVDPALAALRAIVAGQGHGTRTTDPAVRARVAGILGQAPG
ncbi:MAG: guanylate kinase [Gammaproteobacteria bacterium]|nr:guanylate kinase [Gammaproteobacteria bacterium]